MNLERASIDKKLVNEIGGYDNLYRNVDPSLFFNGLINHHQAVFNHILNKHFSTSVVDNYYDDCKQEAIINVWKKLPKTAEEYSKWKSYEMSWSTWLYHHFKWGAQHYIAKKNRIGKSTPVVFTDTVESFSEIAYDEPSRDREMKLTYMEKAIKNLQKPERQMIINWLHTQKIYQSAKDSDLCKNTATKHFHVILSILHDDINLLSEGNTPAGGVRMKVTDALSTGFDHADIRFETHAISSAENYFFELQEAIKKLELSTSNLQDMDDTMCKQILAAAEVVGENTYKSKTRNKVFNIILKSLVDLRIIKLHPRQQFKFQSVPDVKKSSKMTFKRSEQLCLPEKEHRILTALSKERNNFAATADAIGIPFYSLRRIIDSKHGSNNLVELIINYLHFMKLSDLTGIESLQRYNKSGIAEPVDA